MARLVLLGPQRFRPTVRDVVQSLEIVRPLAAVTAGWQEREGENDELRAHVDRDVVDLGLYHRSEEVARRDPELAEALRERQQSLQELQELYRLRLQHALEAARELMQRPGRGGFLDEQRRAAIHATRTLDRQHVRRIRRFHEVFEERWRPSRRPAVAAERAQIAEVLGASGALCIAGGHVAVLLNRLRLFDLAGLLADLPIIAWSAGAMAVSERVVLFHDSPPQGPGNAEIFDAGLDLCRGLVPLPHARRRLHLDDPVRVSLFARRFSPAVSALLEGGGRLDWDGLRWNAAPGTRVLGARGRVREIRQA